MTQARTLPLDDQPASPEVADPPLSASSHVDLRIVRLQSGKVRVLLDGHPMGDVFEPADALAYLEAHPIFARESERRRRVRSAPR